LHIAPTSHPASPPPPIVLSLRLFDPPYFHDPPRRKNKARVLTCDIFFTNPREIRRPAPAVRLPPELQVPPIPFPRYPLAENLTTLLPSSPPGCFSTSRIDPVCIGYVPPSFVIFSSETLIRIGRSARAGLASSPRRPRSWGVPTNTPSFC